MSFLLLMFYWLVIPGLALFFFFAVWRRTKTRVRKTIVAIASLVLFLGLFWLLGGGQRGLVDRQVRELCAKDGGIKVYETVKLPADKFNQWGQPNFFRPTQGENALGPDYIYKSDDHFYRQGAPTMIRYRHQVIRRSDLKLLGETISYGRGGGDLLGPWAASGFHCPPTAESSEIALFKKLFIQSNGE